MLKTHCTDWFVSKTSNINASCFTFYSNSLSILLFFSDLHLFRKSLLPNSITQLPVFLALWLYLSVSVCARVFCMPVLCTHVCVHTCLCAQLSRTQEHQHAVFFYQNMYTIFGLLYVQKEGHVII